jgi:hypothetical protein
MLIDNITWLDLLLCFAALLSAIIYKNNDTNNNNWSHATIFLVL